LESDLGAVKDASLLIGSHSKVRVVLKLEQNAFIALDREGASSLAQVVLKGVVRYVVAILVLHTCQVVLEDKDPMGLTHLEQVLVEGEVNALFYVVHIIQVVLYHGVLSESIHLEEIATHI
jgi:hypothetical protein